MIKKRPMTVERHSQILRDALRNRIPVKVDPKDLHPIPLPEERIATILAREYEKIDSGEDYSMITWKNQVRAADFINENGLSKSIDECLRLNPGALE